jgi:hypothetical protein
MRNAECQMRNTDFIPNLTFRLSHFIDFVFIIAIPIKPKHHAPLFICPGNLLFVCI